MKIGDSVQKVMNQNVALRHKICYFIYVFIVIQAVISVHNFH